MTMGDIADIRTPQMVCPECHAPVRITGKGKVEQHKHVVNTMSHTRRGPRHGSVERRCPKSFDPAPEGAHADWLRGMLQQHRASAARHRQLAADAQAKADGHTRDALVSDSRASDFSAALGAIGAPCAAPDQTDQRGER